MPTLAVPDTSMQGAIATVQTVADLAQLLRLLRRREARSRDGAALTYRELAAKTGWSHAIIGEYFAGTALPPTDRFDELVQLLGATREEIGPLATARDRVEELRRPGRTAVGGVAGRKLLDEPAPRELPAPLSGFVGRGDQLAELDRIAGTRQAATGLPIAAICGGGGIGKSALAREWAHRRAADFPDGQLYIDLHGFGPRRPVAAAEALWRFLRALGVDPGRIPDGLDDRASRYRTAVAGRRMLVVLDNALSAEHVRPLLPGEAGSMVVVTSRDSLAGLVVADGAQRIPLDVLPPAEAVHLLTALVTRERDGVEALARLCDGLPLALRVAGELAAAHPDRPLAEIFANLDDEQGRRILLDAGDAGTVRCALSWSYERLTSGAAELFRLLGAAPGPDCTVAAVASLAGMTVAATRELLGELARAHLICEVSPGRYALRHLLRTYASDLLDHEAAAERRMAVLRLLHHYLHTAVQARRALQPNRAPFRLEDPPSATIVGDFPTGAQARAWLDAERPCLHAAVSLARSYGLDDDAERLARIAGDPALS